MEVLVATVLLQLAVLGVLATLARATEVRTEAERVERATLAATGLLDSLVVGGGVGADSIQGRGFTLRWAVDTSGVVRVVAAVPGVRPLVLNGRR